MKSFVLFAAVLAALAAVKTSSASAKDAVVIVKAAGEAYQGPPRISLLADGRPIGERALRKSFDTESGQRLRDAKNKKDHVEWLKFEVPAIEGVKKLEIQFNNDVKVGKDKLGNRAVHVYGLFIDGYRFRPKTMRPVPADSGGEWGSEAMLWSNGRIQLNRPPKGWKSGYKAATPAE
jgi:hypothetical protein